MDKQRKHQDQTEINQPVFFVFAAKHSYLIYLFLVFLTALSYAQIFSCDFIEAYDDEYFVTHNIYVSQGLTWSGIKWSITSFLTGNWHPLTWWAHMADVSLFGLNPIGHHAVNLLLHICNTLLLYSFLHTTTTYRGRSFIVAALFALHPLHVESVAWVAERKDLLSTATGLMALHFYARYALTGKLYLYISMFALFCLSLMAKPMLVTFPFLLLLLDFWPLRRTARFSWLVLVREKLPLLLPAVTISVLTMMTQHSIGAIMHRPFLMRLKTSLDAYLVYVRKIFFPNDLTSFYPYQHISSSRALIATLLLTFITVAVWRYRHRYAWLLTGWFWFLGLLVPVIGIISVGAQAYADRYTYLPAVGIFIMGVWASAGLVESFKLPAWLAISIIIGMLSTCMVLTWQQTSYWKNGFSLYDREIKAVHGNWHGHFNLGVMLVKRGHYDEGIARYQEALLNTPPSDANIYHNIGMAYEKKGDSTKALDYFRSVIQSTPDWDRGYLDVARILINRGEMHEALSVIRDGQRKVPVNDQLLAKEAYLLHKLGDITAAHATYTQAIKKAPKLIDNYVNLGILLLQQQKRNEFYEVVEQLHHINPAEAAKLARMGNK